MDRPNDVTEQAVDGQETIVAITCLKDLPAEDMSVSEWREVGTCLKELGRVGLGLWDAWSLGCSFVAPGQCAAEWEQLEAGRSCVEGLASVVRIYQHETVHPCPRNNAKPSDYRAALDAMRYSFKLNEMNDDLFCNGIRMSEPLRAVVLTNLREHGYKNERWAMDQILAMAYENRFHPIRDYFLDLEWDEEDRISRLAANISDGSGMFPVFLRKWMIGAVARVFAGDAGAQNMMLVLDGAQGIGKSYLARWLCSPLPSYFREGPIRPEDKDHHLYLCSSFIWEVSELGATTGKAEREALKAFLTEQTVQVRKAYGRTDTHKPAIASFIGTINSDGGFLTDPTGSRRFWVAGLERIDRSYTTLNINQLWAQASALYSAGEKWGLSPEEAKRTAAFNEEHEVEDPLVDHLQRCFDIDPRNPDAGTPMARILDVLVDSGHIPGADLNWSRKVGTALTKLGARRHTRRFGKKTAKIWLGVAERREGFNPPEM